MFNVGLQQALTKSLTLTLNYAGTQSHFLLASGANARGLWTNQLNPKYLVALATVADSTGKLPILGSPATAANVAIVQNALPGSTLPYSSISGPKATTTIAQTLVKFPQYSCVSDTWGNVSNISYNSLQASLAESGFHGLTYTLNYTYSHNIGDDGTFRSGYDIPTGAISNSTKAYKQSRIDRSDTTVDMTHNIAMYGLWEIPYNKAGSFIERALTGGWSISSIYRFTSGTPFVPTYSGCSAPPDSGTCSLDLNPAYTGNGHLVAGGYRHFKTQYIDPKAFAAPQAFGSNLSTNYSKIGNAPRTAPYGLRNPYFWEDDASLHRAFNLGFKHTTFVADITCINVANHATLSNPTATWDNANSTSFGYVTGAQANPRDFQFGGHFNF